jgi:hypothetical protein
MVLVSAGLGLLTYPLVEGRDQGWPAWSFVMLGASLPVLVAFVLYERAKTRRDGSPLVELSMFRDPAFRTGTILSGIFLTAIPAFFLTFSITLQIGVGFSALRTGLTTVPWSLGTSVSSALSVRLAPRLGKRLLSVGCLMLALGVLGVVVTVHQRGPSLMGPELIPALLFSGLGMGCIIAPITNIILASIHHGDAGSASGVLTTTQQVGGALGVAVIGVIFFGLLSSRAGTVADQVLPQLRAQLAAQHLPAGAIARAEQGFRVCFHDRAAENDPSVTPPSCAALQQGGSNPAVAAAFNTTGTTARQTVFVQALERSLFYCIGVFVVSFLLVFLLPRPARREGMPAAAAPH